MSTIVLVESGSTPVTPSTGKVRIWVGTDGILRSIDDAGNVTVYNVTVTNEQIQDVIGAILTDSSSINLTYNDAGDIITADVLPGGVNHNALLNYVSNQHLDHSTLSITAGTGLSGGGDLTATRTISMPDVGTPSTYGSASQVPVLTTDAQGRVSSVINTTISVTSSNITNFSEAVDDRVAALIQSGTGITAVYNDTANTLTLTNTDLGSSAVTAHEAASNPHPQYAESAVIENLFTLTKEPTGFPNRDDSVFSFDNITRTFSISPVAGSFDVYVNGVKITISSTISVTVPNTTGIYHVAINPAGTLVYLTAFSETLLKDYAYVSNFIWSSAQSKTLGIADERHGLTMDWATHKYLHTVIGARINQSSFAIGNFTLDGAGATNAELSASFENGTLTDEDLSFDISHAATPTNYYEQVLTSVAKLPVMYKSGVSGDWVLDSATDYLIKQGTSRPQYNLYSAGSWSSVDAPSGNYIAMWVFCTNYTDQPVRLVLGQASSATLDAAKSENLYESLNLSLFPAQETKVLYRLIFQVSDAYANSLKARLVDITDLKKTIDQGSTVTSVNDHGNLTGLNDDDHLQYLKVDGTRALTGNLSLGTHALTNVTTVNGVTVETHASRHLPGGADALTVGVPSTIGTVNSAGTATAFVRQDHVHAHGAQTDASLHATATTSANGFLSSTDKTFIDTFAVTTPTVAGQIIYWDTVTSKWKTSPVEWSFNTSTTPTSGQLMQWSLTGSKWTMAVAPTTNGQLLQWNSGTSLWTPVSNTSALISDFTEAAQDAIGGSLVDSASIDFTYTDASNTITAAVIPGGVNHNSLLNGGGNTHIDHSTVSISAGTGLSGGGDLTTTRTLSIANVGTAGTYGDTTHYPVITTNAQGQVTAVTTQAISSSAWVDSGGFLTWSDETGKDAVIRQANSAGDSPFLRQVKSRGTLASPTAVQSGDKLGGHGYYGWNSTGQNTSPSIEFSGYATENHTASAQGAELSFVVTPNGSATPATVATIQQDGLWDLKSKRITNAADPVNPQDYVTLSYYDSQSSVWNELKTATDASSSSNTTLTNIADLGFTAIAGHTYYIEYTIRHQSSAAGTGLTLTINTSNTAVGSVSAQVNMIVANDGTAALFTGAITSFGDVVVGSAVPASTTWYIATVRGVFICTTGGTVLPQFRSEVNGSSVTVGAGSIALIRDFV